MDKLDGAISSAELMATEQPTEIICTRVKERKVPRLPVVASLLRFKLLERDERRSRGRGRASMLQARRPKLEDHKPGKQRTAGMDTERELREGGGQRQQEGFPPLASNSKDSDGDQTGKKVVKDTATYSCDSARVTTAENSTGDNDTASASDRVTCPGPSKDVRPKTRQMDRFTFAASHQNVLKEFPSLSDSFMLKPKRVFNLTRANLEKHAKDMDSVQQSRMRGFIETNVDTSQGTSSEHGSIQLYERYSVTLDDIEVFKHQQSQVPQTVKGRVADLLNVANPAVSDFENTADKNGNHPGVSVTEMETSGPKPEYAAQEIGASAGDRLGSEEICHSGNSEGSMDSVMSNFSEYESDPDDIYQSETGESELLDTCRGGCSLSNSNKQKDMIPVPHINEMTLTACCAANEDTICDEIVSQSMVNPIDEATISDSDKKVTNEGILFDGSEKNYYISPEEAVNGLDDLTINDKASSNEVVLWNDVTEVKDNIGSSGMIELPERLINQLDEITIDNKVFSNEMVVCNDLVELEDNKNTSETNEVSEAPVGTMDQLDDITLKDKVASNEMVVPNELTQLEHNKREHVTEDFQNEDDRDPFVEVKYKHKKKRHSKMESTNGKCGKVVIDNTIWRLYGPCVMQITGLPSNCDVSVLQEMVRGFGMIKDEQIRQIDNGCSVRFKFSVEDDCEYAVQTLHNTESLFPDADCVLQCERLKF